MLLYSSTLPSSATLLRPSVRSSRFKKGIVFFLLHTHNPPYDDGTMVAVKYIKTEQKKKKRAESYIVRCYVYAPLNQKRRAGRKEEETTQHKKKHTSIYDGCLLHVIPYRKRRRRRRVDGGVVWGRYLWPTAADDVPLFKRREEEEEEKSNVMGISWRNCFMRENRSAKVEHDRFSREQTQRTETPHDVLLWTHTHKHTHNTIAPLQYIYILSLSLSLLFKSPRT